MTQVGTFESKADLLAPWRNTIAQAVNFWQLVGQGSIYSVQRIHELQRSTRAAGNLYVEKARFDPVSYKYNPPTKFRRELIYAKVTTYYLSKGLEEIVTTFGGTGGEYETF